MNSLGTQNSEDQRLQPLKDKWGDGLRQGFVVVPWVMLRYQKELGVDATELVVLLHLISSWWETTNAPYPSTQAMAKRMSVSVRTVQRCLKSLQAKGLMKKQPQSLANDGNTLVTRYDLQPLSATLSSFVIDQIKVAQKRRNEKAHTLN